MGRIPSGSVPRSERMAIFVTPRTKVDLKKVAAIHRTSVNTIINIAIADYLLNHGTDIQRYDDFFGEE